MEAEGCAAVEQNWINIRRFLRVEVEGGGGKFDKDPALFAWKLKAIGRDPYAVYYFLDFGGAFMKF